MIGPVWVDSEAEDVAMMENFLAPGSQESAKVGFFSVQTLAADREKNRALASDRNRGELYIADAAFADT
jgi:hypothetical protein